MLGHATKKAQRNVGLCFSLITPMSALLSLEGNSCGQSVAVDLTRLVIGEAVDADHILLLTSHYPYSCGTVPDLNRLRH